jgi:sterol desaturase/sphingolipid hydroxylase (fatty acid hydroxylase superfamily)
MLSMEAVFPEIGRLVVGALVSLWTALQLLVLSACVFALIALAVKGRKALAAAERARGELPVNLWLYVIDVLLAAPVIAIIVQAIRGAVSSHSLEFLGPQAWAIFPQPITLFAALFIGDFFSFIRHRIEHTRLLWPAHAIHHSDTEMTWLTLVRFHPINRLTTMVIDTTLLALVGFPEWALIANVMVRHFYGEFIHADLPWTYGPLGRVFVSPCMHRWHHARDVTGAGSNFATLFSVFDQMFGTYYVPGPCHVPLGVTDDIAPGAAGQLMYPFLAWGRRLRAVPATLRQRLRSRMRQAEVS